MERRLSYDMGDEFTHDTTNCSPFIDGAILDVFSTHEVSKVLDEMGESLQWDY